ncbi:hypothetical protein QUA00_16170 [Microcoleus sp. T2B6]|uniref:hypothetical protein n=1 Tax=Microcoleus sp. T2B6 TaxID=3055424 RepID=UPI002FD4D124
MKPTELLLAVAIALASTALPNNTSSVSNCIIPSPHKYSCLKTSKARLASLPRYLSGPSSAFYAVRPVFVIKLYIAPTADKLYARSPARCTVKRT